MKCQATFCGDPKQSLEQELYNHSKRCSFYTADNKSQCCEAEKSSLDERMKDHEILCAGKLYKIYLLASSKIIVLMASSLIVSKSCTQKSLFHAGARYLCMCKVKKFFEMIWYQIILERLKTCAYIIHVIIKNTKTGPATIINSKYQVEFALRVQNCVVSFNIDDVCIA